MKNPFLLVGFLCCWLSVLGFEEVRAQELSGEYQVLALYVGKSEVKAPKTVRKAPGFAIRGREIRGFSGVNRFFGEFVQAPGRRVLAGKGFGATKMAGPPELMKYERAMIQRMELVRGWKVGRRQTILLVDEQGKKLMKLTKLKKPETEKKEKS